MTLGRRAAALGRHARGLTIVLFTLYALAHVGAAIAMWFQYVAQQAAHGEAPELLGDAGYAWELLEQTLQNWQSEFLALATLIALSAVLLHRGSKHSRDGNDEVQQRLQEIQERVDRLVAARGGG